MKKSGKNWNEEIHEYWRVTRMKGKGRYILVRGVLCWGVPMAIIMSLFGVHLHFYHEGYVRALSIITLLSCLGGAGFGWRMWNYLEKKFLEHEE